MEDISKLSREEKKALLEELRKKQPSAELTEFSIELQLALNIFFEGKVTRKGQTIKLFLPNGQKFRVTAESIS